VKALVEGRGGGSQRVRDRRLREVRGEERKGQRREVRGRESDGVVHFGIADPRKILCLLNQTPFLPEKFSYVHTAHHVMLAHENATPREALSIYFSTKQPFHPAAVPPPRSLHGMNRVKQGWGV